jgi:haloacetate dehalogenase
MTLSEVGPPRLRQVAVPGRRLAVRRAGPDTPDSASPAGNGPDEAPPVLLLHGVPETSRCFDRLLPELSRDRIVLAPDLPGLGDSEVRGPYDLGSVASSLLALLAAELDAPDPENAGAAEGEGDGSAVGEGAGGAAEAAAPAGANPPRRVDIVGHDWGGSLALTIAALRPDLVRRLVVVSAPYRSIDLLHAWHVPVLGWTPPALFSSTGRSIVAAMFRYAWRTGRPPAPLVARYADAYASSDRVRAMAGYYRALVRRRSDADRLPTAHPEQSLVVWGTDDPPLPLRTGEAVVSELSAGADPASVRMVTLPGVGHWPLEEAPEVVVPLVADFLRRD